MPNIFSHFPSKYLKEADLQGHDCVLTITHLKLEQVDEQKPEQKPVLYFSEASQGLVLNKTNATTISGLYGENYELWPGRQITLHSATCEAFGKQEPCIRIRPTIPNVSAPQQQPTQQAWQQPGPQGYPQPGPSGYPPPGMQPPPNMFPGQQSYQPPMWQPQYQQGSHQ